MKKSEDNNTAKLIMDMAFHLFVEKGYEATNLREIATEVGINASTIYFYYKSKKDLFLEVFESAFCKHIKELTLRAEKVSKSQNPLAELFQSEIEMIHLNSDSYLFLLRYRMFPVLELAKDAKKICSLYDETEFLVWKPFLVPYADGTLEGEKTIYTKVMKVKHAIINDILLSGDTVSKQTLDKMWIYCSSYLFDYVDH